MQVKLQARRSLCDRGVAQFGSALGSGPRGRGFKSRHLDHVAARQISQQSRRFPALFAFMPAAPFSQKILLRNLFWEPCFSARQISQQSRRFPALFAFMPAAPFSQKILLRNLFWEPCFFRKAIFATGQVVTSPACFYLRKRAMREAHRSFFARFHTQRRKKRRSFLF